jgi:hypothetical protein
LNEKKNNKRVVRSKRVERREGWGARVALPSLATKELRVLRSKINERGLM